MKRIFGLGKPKKKEKVKQSVSVSPEADKVTQGILQGVGVDPESINFLDVFYSAIESKTNNSYVSTILGTGQERVSEGQPANKNIFSGPLEASTHASTRHSEIQTSELQILFANREAYLQAEEFTRQSEKPLADFAKWVLKKAESEPDSKHGNEPIKWLLSGHSRGAVIARLLANDKTHTHTFADGRKVTIESKKNAAFRTITVYNADDKIIKKYTLETNLLLFSATPGMGAKANKDFIHLGAGVKLIDFLAAQDGVLKGVTFKPLTHRRTITQDGSSLFVHMPVYHSAVTKGLQKKTLHLEVEILISYLFSQYAGVDINVDALKLPLRTKSSDSKTTSLLDISLSNGKSFSSENCDIADCIAAIKDKFAAMKSSPDYKDPKLNTDLHEGNDQRFLVMRASVYKTVLEERLALAEQALGEHKSSAGKHPALTHLFEADKSPEAQAYIKFAQLIVNKSGLNDPELTVVENRQEFFLLKTAAILHDKDFTVNLFKIIDSSFGGGPADYEAAFQVIALKNSILSFLEHQPVSRTDKDLKELLIKYLPKILEKNNLKSEVFNNFLASLQNPLVRLDRFIKGTCELKHISRESVAKELEKILTGFSDIRRDSFRQKAMNTIFPPEEKSHGKESPKETVSENEGFVIRTARQSYTLFEHKPSPEKDAPIISDLVCLN
jgi:hypothetical protein